MSNSLAIAAITMTLQNLIYQTLKEDLDGGNVTTLPLDKARNETTNKQINLFLYHFSSNTAFSNRHPVAQVRRGDNQKGPLALDLFYLISVYGDKDNEIESHQLLGKVMSLFHDVSKITSEIIESATVQELRESNLHQQVEQINITPLFFSFEEILKIWQGVSVSYRPCVCYQVSVVLIDSQIPLNVPLPVLFLNNGQSQVSQKTFLPSLTAIELPHRQPSAQLGDIITLRGQNLDRPNLKVKLTHNQLKQSLELDPLTDLTADKIQIKIPDIEAETVNQWYIGLYIVAVIFQEGENDQKQSNELPLVLAPRITALSPKETHEGKIYLKVNCQPPLHSKQKALVLWGDQVFPTRKQTNSAANYTRLTCQIPAASTGEYVIRLRVDGVDNIPVDFSTIPWQFDRNQIVIVS
ncbi:conserved hypothetical protein [Gloeothece citriformis PCC 7424]|uniref:Pvc16 N-terminal domain-containing protein n=1 Tax=Gloeothece citriformis (strain PCC 7424) TaxID=65393 RepID=B7KB64_GLOC7|nr:DUF4255 domain-containing protein [Gloeothece citriformis]ACK70174.1 conserved hypothetical protein [Gloeothece citriformis PCC 7424]